MYMIQIEEGKMDKLSEHIEQSLRHMGKAMQCVDEWMEEGGMKEHSGYGMRGGYGMRYNQGGRYGGYGMGYKDDEDWDDEEMAERRGGRRRDSRGRYM
jgi:hypothetical protein